MKPLFAADRRARRTSTSRASHRGSRSPLRSSCWCFWRPRAGSRSCGAGSPETFRCASRVSESPHPRVPLLQCPGHAALFRHTGPGRCPCLPPPCGGARAPSPRTALPRHPGHRQDLDRVRAGPVSELRGAHGDRLVRHVRVLSEDRPPPAPRRALDPSYGELAQGRAARRSHPRHDRGAARARHSRAHLQGERLHRHRSRPGSANGAGAVRRAFRRGSPRSRRRSRCSWSLTPNA